MYLLKACDNNMNEYIFLYGMEWEYKETNKLLKSMIINYMRLK